MAKKPYTDDISFILTDKSFNQDVYETTYKSSYGRFHQDDNNKSCNNLKFYQNYVTNNLTNYKYSYNNYHKNIHLENYLKTSQDNKPSKNPKLVCPNCINENILKAKSLNRLKRNKIYETEYFEDKMKLIHENKKKDDIKNRENRAKDTYISLFKNRDRSAQQFNNIETKNKGNGYFGHNIEYGMLRCRNRELKNDKKLFGLYLLDKTENKNSNDININTNHKEKANNLKTNKSWLGPKNYLLDKNEYSFIINKQMEKDDKKTKKERYEKIKEEKNYLNAQLNKEKSDINKEICCKNKRRYEMNKINSNLLISKKIEEYKRKRSKKHEKDCISLICKKQLDEMVRRFRQKRLNNINVEKENKKISEEKKLKNKKDKILMNRNYEGLVFTGTEQKSCENCNRLYPKNVLSYMYYTFNEQQKDDKNL